MLNVTDKAVDVLAKSLDASDAGEEKSLRLARTAQGDFGLALDSEREGDQVVKQEERSVLFVEPEIVAALDGATLDVIEGPEGAKLTLRMPEEA